MEGGIRAFFVSHTYTFGTFFLLVSIVYAAIGKKLLFFFFGKDNSFKTIKLDFRHKTQNNRILTFKMVDSLKIKYPIMLDSPLRRRFSVRNSRDKAEKSQVRTQLYAFIPKMIRQGMTLR
uniref:Uncharacterized protein n=1 Tax=Strigamia maritima TaxID=126957 RepID=T1JHK7_STRMM